MTRTLFSAVVSIALLTGGSASAHHGYVGFLTEHPITIEGTLEQIQYGEPHVLMKIRADDSTLYTVTWQ